MTDLELVLVILLGEGLVSKDGEYYELTATGKEVLASSGS